MTDLISRADAIEAVCRTRCGDKAKGCPAHSCLVIEEFDALPSAETHEIRTETHGVCLISKDDAMGAVQDHFNANGFKGYDDGQKMMDRIKALPSAELPKGDLISRADVLKYPIRLDHYDEVNGNRLFVYGVESVIEYVESLPSADAVPQGRLIDADSLISDLEEWKENPNNDDSAVDLVNHFIGIIRATPSAYAVPQSEQYKKGFEDAKRAYEIELARSADAVQGEWIPCSERLPSKDGCYLVSTTGTNNDIIDIAYYTEGMIWRKASRIKAWQPLPKPYREDGEDNEED